MKKIFPALLIIACLSFIASCKKSDEKLIIGTWDAKSLRVKSYLRGSLTGDVSQDLQPGFEAFEFRKDETFTNYVYDKVNDSGTYFIEGDKLTMNDRAGTFSISKTEMSMVTISEKKLGNNYIQRDEFYWILERR